MERLPNPIEILFAAERCRDWETLRSVLHPSVVWTIVGSEESLVAGADAYIARLRHAYERDGAVDFTVRRVLFGVGGKVATELVDDVGNISIDIFELDKNGLVTREWEHVLGSP